MVRTGSAPRFTDRLFSEKSGSGTDIKNGKATKLLSRSQKLIANAYRFVVERGMVDVDVPLFIIELSRERVRRLLFPVVPLPLRSVLFIESLPFMVEPLCIVPVPVEYVPLFMVLLPLFIVPFVCGIVVVVPVFVFMVPVFIVPEPVVVGGWVWYVPVFVVVF